MLKGKLSYEELQSENDYLKHLLFKKNIFENLQNSDFVDDSRLKTESQNFQPLVNRLNEIKNLKQELKKCESLYKNMFYDNNSIMLIIDPENGKIIDVNKSAIKFYGYSKNKFSSLFIEDLNISSKVQIEHKIQNVLDDKKNNFMFQHKLANGEIKDVDVYSGKIIYNEKICLYSIIHDVTDIKHTLRALKESEHKLKTLNNTKDKFFSIIAHDLRSPFSGILGFSELLIKNVKDFDDSKSEKYLNIISNSAKKTLVLLDNLLAWAKSQIDEIHLEQKILNSSSIIDEIIEDSRSLAEFKNISLNYDSNSNIFVFADENMVKTILRNLISNAIKFTNTNGAINISQKVAENQVAISISDNGVGMNNTIMKNLFNVTNGITSLGTANEKGSGLGLALCKEFVEKHGGEIWVESEEGIGSHFKFTLPLYN